MQHAEDERNEHLHLGHYSDYRTDIKEILDSPEHRLPRNEDNKRFSMVGL